MKGQLKIIFLSIMCVLTSFFIMALLFYLLMGSTAKSADRKQTIVDTSAAASSADDSDIVSSSPDSSESEAMESDIKEISGETDKVIVQEEDASPFSFLYNIYEDAPFYLCNNDLGEAYFDYADGYLSGYYTGTPSELYDGFLQLDYRYGYALVSADSAEVVIDAKVLPLGVISQITSDYNGYSGCGPACLAMAYGDKNPDYSDYVSLLNYAEYNGYADQGSLMQLGGGMTSTMLTKLALDVYGIRLINAYSNDRLPSELIKELIDEGRLVIALVKHHEGTILIDKDGGHFIVINGYSETEDSLDFYYGNPYYYENMLLGKSLSVVDAELLDISIKASYDEPNAIIYAE